ncbi:choice-of-anchor M domain-containing protein [Xylanimonas ulmi]|nr:choice-of-anchor M domain-containing protein [Xylanibacterium ulmi]
MLMVSLTLNLTVSLVAPTPAIADTPAPDTDLDQTIDAGQPVARGARVLETGHVDLGPRFDGGRWRLLVHDDAAKSDAAATSVWRDPAETVLRVLDTAAVEAPDDPAYAFLGAQPGQLVWVVPQTQNPQAVWLGWNTQDPEVMRRIDRGVTLSMVGAQGPGSVSVFLQASGFAQPQVLWDSRSGEEQPAWVDVNTHTHANWVFTQPGVYLVRLRVEADLVDGTHVADTQVIRFAVGSQTPTDDALTARWQGGEPGASATAGAADVAADEAADGWDGDRLGPVLLIAAAALLAMVAAAAGVAAARSRRAKRRALGLGVGRGPAPRTPDPAGATPDGAER